MSGPLPAEALALLDFLCTMKAKGARVTELKTPEMKAYHRQLQDAGLVKWHSMEPTGWALADWHKSKHIHDQPEHAPAERLAAAEDPNESSPANKYSYVRQFPDVPPPLARHRCPSCQAMYAGRTATCADCRILFDTIGKIAKVLNRKPRSTRYVTAKERKGYRNTGARKVQKNLSATSGRELADLLDAWCAKTGAAKIRVGLALFNSCRGLAELRRSRNVHPRTEAKVRAFLASPPDPKSLPERNKSRKPAVGRDPKPPSEIARDYDKMRLRTIAATQKRRATTREKARALVDAGVSTSNPKLNAAERVAMNDFMRRDADAARLANPVEKAKTLIRSRGIVCFDASVYDGEKKGKGFYYINRERVTEARLLQFADELRAKCRS